MLTLRSRWSLNLSHHERGGALSRAAPLNLGPRWLLSTSSGLNRQSSASAAIHVCTFACTPRGLVRYIRMHATRPRALTVCPPCTPHLIIVSWSSSVGSSSAPRTHSTRRTRG